MKMAQRRENSAISPTRRILLIDLEMNTIFQISTEDSVRISMKFSFCDLLDCYKSPIVRFFQLFYSTTIVRDCAIIIWRWGF